MKNVKIIEENCISCGQCQAICEEVFVVEEIAKVIVTNVNEELTESVQDAVESCPTGAIIWEEEKQS